MNIEVDILGKYVAQIFEQAGGDEGISSFMKTLMEERICLDADLITVKSKD